MMKIIQLAVIAIVTMVFVAQAAEDSELAKLKGQYDTALAKHKAEYETNLVKIARQYIAVLDELMRKHTRAGNLDGALAVREEKNRVSKIHALNLPEEIRTPPKAEIPDKPQANDVVIPQAPAKDAPKPKEEYQLSGTQADDTRKLTAGKPYVLKGVYVVPAGKELRLEAGTVVLAEKEALLSVSGKLCVEGTEQAPVIFKGKATGSAFWKGITLKDSTGSTVWYAQVSGAETAFETGGRGAVKINGCVFAANDCALRIIGGKNSLENCLITGNKKTAIETGSCEADFVSCTVSRNGGTGIFHVWAGPIRIEKCIFTENKDGGIRTRSAFEAHNSILTGNQKYDVLNDACYGKSDMDFSSNWWGEQGTQRLIQKGETADLPGILDGHDDAKTGLIKLDKFLKEKPKDCGATVSDKSK